MIKKRLLLFILTLLPMLAMADDSGSCGDNVTYTFVSSTGTLTIQGSGRMKNYSSTLSAPWYSYMLNIKTVIIGEGVTSVGAWAFYHCSSLTSVTIPNSVTSFGEYSFDYCLGLTSITIPNGVTYIGPSAFYKCSGLTSVTIPNGVTTIGLWAFYKCSGLVSVTIGNNVNRIEGSIGCSLGLSAFEGCSSLTSVTIGSGVTSIAIDAFANCSNLQKVIVPNLAAWCCISFGSHSANPLYYAHHIYSDENTEIKRLIIPNSVKFIRTHAFSGCSGLTSVTIPNSVTSIEYGAFSGCSGLTSVTIPNSVTSIEGSAFNGCSGLTSITVAQGNTKYDSRDNCNAIIESASNKLIAGCKTTIIPNGVTSIGSSAFNGCSGLTSITIPNSVTSIGSSAFNGCSGLTSITIPNSVTSIGISAFRGCSGLTSVTIPNSVTSIGSSAFEGCSGLQKVYSKVENVFTINYNTFDTNTYSNAKLYVPIGKKATYQSTDGWKYFANIEEFDVTNIAAQYRSKDARIVDVYKLNGQRSDDVRRGVNIIRMSDGTTRKVVVK